MTEAEKIEVWRVTSWLLNVGGSPLRDRFNIEVLGIPAGEPVEVMTAEELGRLAVNPDDGGVPAVPVKDPDNLD